MTLRKTDKKRRKELEDIIKKLDNKRLDVLANFGTYAPKIVIRRVIIISIVSLVIFFIAALFTKSNLPTDPKVSIPILLFIVLAFNSVSEANVFLSRLIRRFQFVKDRPLPLSIFFLIITSLIITFWIKLGQQLFEENEILAEPLAQLVLLFGVILLFILHLLIMMSGITREWMDIRKELEQLQQAKLESDYNSLKDRLNPHFLFNNLSVLRSLIRYDAQAAETFTQNFTDVYRYLLRSHEKKTVSLKSELAFLDAYISLHKERLGEGLFVERHIADNCLQKEVPPMAVQLLVENAIKHNIASRQHPLKVNIFTRDGDLYVSNIINKKETTYSTQTGLKTLQAQVQLLTHRDVVINNDGKLYEVKLPLL